MCETCNDTGVVVANGGVIASFQKCLDCDRTEEIERELAWVREQVAEWRRKRGVGA